MTADSDFTAAFASAARQRTAEILSVSIGVHLPRWRWRSGSVVRTVLLQFFQWRAQFYQFTVAGILA